MQIAVINNGAVVDVREGESIPPHKLGALLPIEGAAPTADDRFYTVTGPVYQIQSDKVQRVWQVTPRDIADVKATLLALIKREAGVARQKYVTSGFGKDMEYREVSREATSYLSGFVNGTYPLLQASVNAGEAADIAAAAALVDLREKATMEAYAIIREREIAAKIAVTNAQNVEQAIAAATVTWP